MCSCKRKQPQNDREQRTALKDEFYHYQKTDVKKLKLLLLDEQQRLLMILDDDHTAFAKPAINGADAASTDIVSAQVKISGFNKSGGQEIDVSDRQIIREGVGEIERDCMESA
eukprot:TRINITY_DN16200_c0_g1_i1.p2 TRINITY_DN16200_c0_g1~~TRINITY_DN16200_c0_g1_i1.p2  ORF type:complete len:113 (-),score=23.03 TRINITY_DN16200_c0_g1_i1:308-646(-)